MSYLNRVGKILYYTVLTGNIPPFCISRIRAYYSVTGIHHTPPGAGGREPVSIGTDSDTGEQEIGSGSAREGKDTGSGLAARPDAWNDPRYIALTISSTIFFASENSIMVLSRKNSSFSIPA